MADNDKSKEIKDIETILAQKRPFSFTGYSGNFGDVVNGHPVSLETRNRLIKYIADYKKEHNIG